jgi:hypothetical protein
VRWRQLDNSDGDFDNWGIDNVELTSGEFGDDFDPDIDSGEWVEISGGTAENDFNGSDGNALYFTGGNSRFATSRFISPDVGDMLSFDIIYGSDVNGGENPEDGEEVVLEYSFDGSSWDQLAQYPLSITSWSTRQVAIPGGADVDQIEGDSGTTDFTFTVSRQGVTAFPSTIDWEITGSGASPANAADFVGGVLPSGSLSFSAGEVQKSITVQVSGDSQFEADETFDLVLADAGIMETATIINDDEASNSGDFDGDGFYACSDVDALVQAIAGQTAGGMQFDLSGDGSLTNEDLELWLAEAGAANLASGNPYLHGDANLDGAVDVQDFNVWNANKFTTGTGWCSADFNADGVVDVLDFNSWNANKFQSADSAVSSVSDQPVIVMSNVASVSRPEVKRYDVRAAVFADYDVNA